MLGTNIVKGKELRKIQKDTLTIIKESLLNTFGPNGSTTMIKKAPTEFANTTKDGHTVLSNIRFSGVIESTVVQEINELTTHIVKTVGDGTTSAIVLSSIIFDYLVDSELQGHPSTIIAAFKEAVEDIIKVIDGHGKHDITLDDIYNIALTSTNNNHNIAEILYNIYKEFGNDVFIDVGISNDENTKIKYYNGTTLRAGYLNSVMITNQEKGTAELPNPNIYIFRDPVDTPDMVNLMNAIISKNIVEPFNESGNVNSCINTVIMAPKISIDLAQTMNELVMTMHHYKFPLLIITNIFGEEVYEDLIVLTGAKPINRYIDPELQKIDIANGKAPTIENITTFAGTTELIVSDAVTTKFIRPLNMYKEGTEEYTVEFDNLIKALEAELQMAYENNETVAVTGKLKRRINALKSNMVELLIGGVSIADRDSVRDLVEDAVKSLRSACQYGIGNGSNYEGYRASNDLLNEQWKNGVKSIFRSCDDQEEIEHHQSTGVDIENLGDRLPTLKEACIEIIANAYCTLLETLYSVSGYNDQQITRIFEEIEDTDLPYNIRTECCDGNVLTSIESDKVILSTISKIVTLMYTSNQFLLPDPAFNKYMMD